MRRQTREHGGSTGDTLIGRYVDWREASFAVRSAYERWREADRDDSEAAFAAYSAALDREELASNLYAELVERIARTAPHSG